MYHECKILNSLAFKRVWSYLNVTIAQRSIPNCACDLEMQVACSVLIIYLYSEQSRLLLLVLRSNRFSAIVTPLENSISEALFLLFEETQIKSAKLSVNLR